MRSTSLATRGPCTPPLGDSFTVRDALARLAAVQYTKMPSTSRPHITPPTTPPMAPAEIPELDWPEGGDGRGGGADEGSGGGCIGGGGGEGGGGEGEAEGGGGEGNVEGGGG